MRGGCQHSHMYTKNEAPRHPSTQESRVGNAHLRCVRFEGGGRRKAGTQESKAMGTQRLCSATDGCDTRDTAFTLVGQYQVPWLRARKKTLLYI